jgi:dihydrodipicolinate synthase/N-acetylneuraminate lyase
MRRCAGAAAVLFQGCDRRRDLRGVRRLIDGVGDNRLRLYLYHIPQVSGVGLSVAMVSRLAAAYPAIVAGVKDSSGASTTRALVAALPQLSIFVGRAALPALRKLAARERSAASPICIRA